MVFEMHDNKFKGCKPIYSTRVSLRGQLINKQTAQLYFFKFEGNL
jgi:hypothetical protein